MSNKPQAVPNVTDEGVTAADAMQRVRELQLIVAQAQAQLAASMKAAGLEKVEKYSEEQKARIDAFFYEADSLDAELAPLLEARRDVNVRYTAFLKSIVHDPLCKTCNGKTEKEEDKLHKIVIRDEKQRERYALRRKAEKAAAKSK